MSPKTSSFLASCLALSTLAGALVACAATPEDADAEDDVGSSEGAVITSKEQALVGSYRRADASSPILGLTTKHPTRNYAFEKKVVFGFDVDPVQVPGVCRPGETECLEQRVSGTLSAGAKILELKPENGAQVRPALAPFLGKYRYTIDATSLVLTKVGSPATVYRFTKGSYCSSEYDCNMARPDDACIINYSCNAQHSCDVVQQDPWCDASFRSVADLGDIGGTWTSSNAPAGAFVKLELTPSAPGQGSSNGAFKGTTSSGAVKTGNFAAMPENPAIGFANLTLEGGGQHDLFWVKGVQLSPAKKVVAMQVLRFSGNAPSGSAWIYTRQP